MRNVKTGMDLDDKKHIITILDEDGVITKSCSLNNTRASIITDYRIPFQQKLRITCHNSNYFEAK